VLRSAPVPSKLLISTSAVVAAAEAVVLSGAGVVNVSADCVGGLWLEEASLVAATSPGGNSKPCGKVNPIGITYVQEHKANSVGKAKNISTHVRSDPWTLPWLPACIQSPSSG
jgi:hypothetical protein